MPALPPVASVIRVDLQSTYGGDANSRDRLFFRYTGTLSSADLLTILGTIGNSWNTNLAGLVTNTDTLNAVLGTDLSSPTAPQQLYTHSYAGTNTNASVASLCTVVRFKIARRYRGGHPRMYLGGGPSLSVQSNGLWSAAYVTLATTDFTNFIAGCIATPPVAVGTLSHVNVSYYSGFTVVTNPVTHRARNVPTQRISPAVDTVLSYSVNVKPGSQRRRNLQSA